jgi:hypothetical protein
MHIGNTGEVPTRSRNWHDWFNALAWLAWPHSKAALNARHVRAIAAGRSNAGHGAMPPPCWMNAG